MDHLLNSCMNHYPIKEISIYRFIYILKLMITYLFTCANIGIFIGTNKEIRKFLFVYCYKPIYFYIFKYRLNQYKDGLYIYI